MSRRIDIELTSARPDGTWTWRAAGALKPRGVLDGALLPGNAKPGDLLRADADFEIEGIAIVAVLKSPTKKRSEPERIEVLGPEQAPGPAVTTELVAKAGRGPADRGRDRGEGRLGERKPAPRPERPGGPRRDGARRDGARREGARPEGVAGEAAAASPARPAQERRRRAEAPARGARRAASIAPSGGPGPGAGQADGSAHRPSRGGDHPAPAGRDQRAAGEPALPRPRRLNPSNTHRRAVMSTLAPEEQAIADQVLRGGIPAVRTAIQLEKQKAAAEGRAAPNADSLLALAEGLLPRLKAAEWRDRAEAAVKVVDQITLRDLRSVVAGADVARDDDTRLLATNLREALERRIAAQQREWLEEITAYLDEGRLVRALRVASRPPDASNRLPPEVADRLSAAASEAMGPDVASERWLTLLEAVVASPVRRMVQPVGLPAEPGADLLRVARQQAGRLPALASMLGITMPPPPGPIRPAAPGRPGAPRSAPMDAGPRRSAPESTAAATSASAAAVHLPASPAGVATARAATPTSSPRPDEPSPPAAGTPEPEEAPQAEQSAPNRANAPAVGEGGDTAGLTEAP